MRYLTRKPIPPMPAAPAEIPETSDERFSKDVEFIDKVQTQGDTQNEIGTGTEGDPGTEVDQDQRTRRSRPGPRRSQLDARTPRQGLHVSRPTR